MIGELGQFIIHLPRQKENCMTAKKIRPYTAVRRERVIEEYKKVIANEITQAEKDNKPNRAKCLSKSYLYQEVAERTGYDPVYVARLIQSWLKSKGMSHSRHSKMTEIMDEEIQFILKS
jgi:hypothetical protein